MSYLGVSDQETQNSNKQYATHNILSTVNSSRPNTNEESKRKDVDKDYEVPRSGRSFVNQIFKLSKLIELRTFKRFFFAFKHGHG